MARQFVRVRGVGGGRGGHAGIRRPSAQKIAVRRVSHGKRKA